MIEYVTGNILESKAECLINTVNCEGYMGKGIAYQFKQAFPENFLGYEKVCKKGLLRPGKLFIFEEKNKIIINFPTKDKWRNKSTLNMIEDGLDELVRVLKLEEPSSVAIPPLGCGNGGLLWPEVKPLIESKISILETTKFYIYEPSKYYSANISSAPKMNVSHLILMLLKMGLVKYNKTFLQKSSYFFNIYLGENFFEFHRATYGPYSRVVDYLSKQIKEYQEFYKVNTDQAYLLCMQTLVSASILNKLERYKKEVYKSLDFVNKVKNTRDLELVATVCYIIQEKRELEVDDIYKELDFWLKRKAQLFSTTDVKNAIEILLENGLIYYTLMNTLHIRENEALFHSID